MTGRTLVAGVGNIFLGDDGFGVEVVRRLGERELPEGVEVADFGIRGVHLAYQLLEGYDLLVLVDALPRGEPAGTVTLLEPDLSGLQAPAAAMFDAHGMQPDLVLGLLGVLADAEDGPDRAVRRVVVVGCEPARVDDGIGLSDEVAAAVDEAVRMVLELVASEGDGDDEVDLVRAGAAGAGRGGRDVVAGRDALPEDPADVSG